MPRETGVPRSSRRRRAPARGALRAGTMLAGPTLAGTMLCAALAAPARAQEVAYHGVVQASSGDYLFTERMTSVTLLNGLSLTAGRLRLSAILPLYFQNSTAVTYVGGAPVPTGGPDAAAVRRRRPGEKVPMGPGRRGQGGPTGAVSHATAGMHGTVAAGDTAALVVTEPGDYRVEIGDPLLQIGVDLLQDGTGGLRSVTVSALAKAPVADVGSGVGTGEWDYGAGLSLGFGGARTFVLADASYWVVGDLPELPLRNTLSYALSVGRSLGSAGRWSVLGSVTGATAMIDHADAPVSLGLGVGYAPGSTRGFSAGVGVGLTETAPDLSSYVGWSVALGGR